jgi:uncharacterized membrane protein YvlD (DUF360 family)
MVRLFLHWILNAVALLVVSHMVEGFVVNGFVSALIAVIVIGLFNRDSYVWALLPVHQCGDFDVLE